MKKGVGDWVLGIRDVNEYLRKISVFKITIQWSFDSCLGFGIWDFGIRDSELGILELGT